MYPIKSSGFWFGNPLVIKNKNCEKNNDKKVCMDAGTSVEGVIGNSTRKNIWWNTWGRLTIRSMNLRVAFATNTADLLIPSVNTSLVYLQPLYIYSLTLGFLISFKIILYVGPLPKQECKNIFSICGCRFCLTNLESPNARRIHQERCQFSNVSYVIIHIS